MKKRRAITLIEMIIVMLLIATITGAIAYNYRESLNQGKVFKTREAVNRIETIVNLALAEDPNESTNIQQNWQEYVRKSPLVKDPKDFYNDAWGGPYQVILKHSDDTGQPYFSVESENLKRYDRNKKGQ
jgi:type II secretory pathway pseudopilin PulG